MIKVDLVYLIHVIVAIIKVANTRYTLAVRKLY